MSHYRLEYLREVVDLFVIAEARYTFSGIYKQEYWMDTYKHWLTGLERENKVLKVRVEQFPMDIPLLQALASTSTSNGTGSIGGGVNLNIPPKNEKEEKRTWARERYLKDHAVIKMREHIGDRPYILILCDADELPRRELVANFTIMYPQLANSFAGLEMMFFSFNWKWLKRSLFKKARIVGSEWIKQNLSTYAVAKYGKEPPLGYIKNAGWHASNFMTAKRLVLKLRSSIHAFDAIVNRPGIIDETWIQHCIDTGNDILNRTKGPESLQPYLGTDLPTLPPSSALHDVTDIASMSF
jgi:Glycosyltransferase family 17